MRGWDEALRMNLATRTLLQGEACRPGNQRQKRSQRMTITTLKPWAETATRPKRTRA
jgi:hypothetical protein